jgi:hypothetical protein
MTTSDWIIALNGIAILLAPIVALKVGGVLQQRSDAYKSKLRIFSTLIGLRHAPLSTKLVEALNQIDAVFAHDHAVREAWTRYYTALNDPSMNAGPGASIREEKRRELLLEMVKALKLTRRISSADLLRTYLPTFVAEDTYITLLERIQKRAALEEDLTRRRLPIPPSIVPGPRSPRSLLFLNRQAQPLGMVRNNRNEPWCWLPPQRQCRQNNSIHPITSPAAEHGH